MKCFSHLLLPVLFLSCIISAGGPFLGRGFGGGGWQLPWWSPYTAYTAYPARVHTFFTGLHLQPEPEIWLNGKPPEGMVHSLRFFYFSPCCSQLLSYHRCTMKTYYHINRNAHSLVLGKQWTMNVEDSMTQQQEQQKPKDLGLLTKRETKL